MIQIMSILKSLLNYLDNHKIKYEVINHRTVYTARDKAATLHLDPKIVVKIAVIKYGPKDYLLSLVPANKNIDKPKLKKTINTWLKKENKKLAKTLAFAGENWMKKNIQGNIGATPPFGELFKLPTFVDGILLRQQKLIINTGDYNQSIKLTKASFLKGIGEIVKASFSKKK